MGAEAIVTVVATPFGKHVFGIISIQSLKAVRSSMGSPTGFGQSKYGGSCLLTFSNHLFFQFSSACDQPSLMPVSLPAGDVDADLQNLTRGNDR